MISKSMSVDLGKDGILVYAIHPGKMFYCCDRLLNICPSLGWVLTDMGGPNALINTETSILGMLNSIQNADPSLSGRMLNYDGKVLPW